MRKALSDKTVSAAKPQAKRYDIRDTHFPNFGVRVSPRGGKSFFVSYRHGPKQKRMTIGTYPRTSLSAARAKAMDALRQVDEGIDPAGRRRQPGLLVDAVVKDFIRQYAKPRNRTWKDTQNMLERELVTPFGQCDIRTITRAHLLEIMDAAIDRGAGYRANRILCNVRKLFNWCLERGIVETNPAQGIKAPVKEEARDRVLSEDELRRVVTACRNESYPFGPIVLLLLATAQRRGELAEMKWNEINFDNATWEIPSARSKNKRANVVPLTPFALSILETMPRFVNCDYVFTTTRKTPVSGFSKMLKRISEGSETSDWHLHDLRRTAASGMAQVGVAPHVVEKVLNHSSGIISGVAAVYNRYGYVSEKREALENWCNHLEALEASDAPLFDDELKDA
jgi:integrase